MPHPIGPDDAERCDPASAAWVGGGHRVGLRARGRAAAWVVGALRLEPSQPQRLRDRLVARARAARARAHDPGSAASRDLASASASGGSRPSVAAEQLRLHRGRRAVGFRPRASCARPSTIGARRATSFVYGLVPGDRVGRSPTARARAAGSGAARRGPPWPAAGRRRITTSAVKSFSPRIRSSRRRRRPPAPRRPRRPGSCRRRSRRRRRSVRARSLARSSAWRTFRTSCGLTPRGSKRPICGHSERSTIVLEVSRRTPQSRSPEARATASAVAPSHCRSRRGRRCQVLADERGEASRGLHGIAAVRRHQAVRDGAEPRPPHQDACASVETPIAPATWAA